MKIRTWLTAANICLVAIFVSIGFLGYEIRKIENNLEAIHADRISKIILIQELENSTNALASFALKYIITQDKSAKESYDKLLDIRHGKAVRPYTTLVSANETVSLQALLEKHHLSGENRTILEELLIEIQKLEASNMQAFVAKEAVASKNTNDKQSLQSNNVYQQRNTNTPSDTHEDAFDTFQQDNAQNTYSHLQTNSTTQVSSIAESKNEAPFIYDALYQSALMEIHSRVNKLIAQIHENARLTSHPLKVILESYIFYVQILLAVGIAILFLITILCYTNIIARINKASAFIAHMRLSRSTKSIKVGSKDEISILNSMLNTLATKYQLLVDTQEAYAQVQNLSRQTQPVITELTHLSKEIEHNLTTATQNTTAQASNITELVDSVREMNSSVADVAKNASSAADIAGQTKTKAEDGERFVQNLIASIETVHNNSSSLKEDMTTLLNHAKKVNEIMGVITDIADQTNLLALNAAIEAARAGDAGRGFAVVADEVRKLAEKTMLSTTGVGNAIESIQSSVQNSTEQVDVTVENINNVTTIASECGIALQEIVFMAENSADQIRIIAIAAEEQSSSADAIASTISNISNSADDQKIIMDSALNALKDLESSQDKLTNCVDFIALSNVQTLNNNEEENTAG